MRKYILLSLIILAGIPFLAQAAVSEPASLTVSAKSACTIGLNWAGSPTPGVNYEAQYTTAGNFPPATPGQPVGITAALNLEHQNLAPNSGLDYRYRVRAVNSANQLDYSSWVYSIPAAIKTSPLAAPADPANLSVVGKSGGQQSELSWTSPALSDFGGFEVWRSIDGTNFTKVGTGSKLFAGSYTDGTAGNFLDPAKIYYYKVRNFESDYGCAPGSEIFSAYSATVKVPVMPENLNAIYQFSPSQVNLAWTAGAGQSYYEIHRAKNSGAFSLLTTANNISFSDTSIDSNQKYSYKVRGCTAGGGCSDFTNTIEAVIVDTPQNPAAQIYYAEGTKGNVRISWDNTFPSSDYVLERSVDGGNFSEFKRLSSAPANLENGRIVWRDDNLTLLHIYTYRVYSDFGGYRSSNSLPVSANLNIDTVISGQAWATIDGKGVGWVHFNSGSTPPPPGVLYSVQVDKDGLMSGVAWAAIDGNDDYGWLSFNKSDLTGCPIAGTCDVEARVSAAGVMSGWARFLAPKNYSGTWDGWVSLGNNGVDAKSSIVLNGSKNFVGSAWGGDIVGWLAFTEPECVINNVNECTVSAATLNQPPAVSNVQVNINRDSWCTASPYYSISWNYNDPENNSQTSAEIRVFNKGLLKMSLTSNTNDHFTTLSNPLTVIEPNSPFYISVRATDGNGGFSQWVDSATMTAPGHYYPIVDFDWTPKSTISVGSQLTFTDKTNTRSDPVRGIRWEFLPDGAIPNFSTASPSATVTVNKLPLDANLIVTDMDGNACQASYTIQKSGNGTLKRRIFRER